MKPKLRIAFADDSIFQRILIRNLTKRFNELNLIFLAKNGQHLLQKLERTSPLPEICIIDLNMPKMDGIHVATEISERFPTIRLFGYSSSVDTQKAEFLKQHGIEKAFSIKSLQVMLKSISKYNKLIKIFTIPALHYSPLFTKVALDSF